MHAPAGKSGAKADVLDGSSKEHASHHTHCLPSFLPGCAMLPQAHAAACAYLMALVAGTGLVRGEVAGLQKARQEQQVSQPGQGRPAVACDTAST